MRTKPALLMLALAATVPATQAQTGKWPDKPVRVVVPFAPGGGVDVMGRAFAQKLSEAIGQPVIIDNRPGASTNIGTALVAKAVPDGHTLLFTNNNLMINPFVLREVPFDPVRDFAPISNLAFAPLALFLNLQVPAQSVKELIALAKSQAGKLNYSSGGIGGPPHLAGEMFKQLAGVDIVHVPYSGAAPALTELVGGRVQMNFASLPSAQAFLKAGRIKALAVASNRRLAAAPDIPTFAESGLPGLEIGTMFGLLAPARTPPRVIERMVAETLGVLKTQHMKDLIVGQGADIIGNSPAEFARYIKADMEKWSKLTRSAGIRPE